MSDLIKDDMNKSSVVLPEHQQLAHRFALSVQDMEEVIQHLQCYQEFTELHDADGQPRWALACRALLSAAIVAYCRPFTENKSSGYAKQKLSISQLQSVHVRRNLHELIMKKRNTFIAHADWSARSAELARMDATSLGVSFTEPNVWEGIDVQEFLILAGGVKQECMGRAFALTMASAVSEAGR